MHQAGFKGREAPFTPIPAVRGQGFDELGELARTFRYYYRERSGGGPVPLHGVRYEIRTADVTGKDPFETAKEAVAELGKNDHCRLVLKGETERPV